MRSALVNERRLAKIAAEIRLGEHLLLGRGESQSNGQKKKSILADAFEALLAAVYLDGGFEAVYTIIANRFARLIDFIDDPHANRDYKSRLQEHVQENQLEMPQYALLEAKGPDHDKTFRIQVSVGPFNAVAEGKTKKAAQQQAACKLLEKIIFPKPAD